MKRSIIVLVALMVLNFTVKAQDDASIPGGGSSNTTALPNKSFYVNPLGLLQFGPMIGTEMRLGDSNGYISPHIRIGYLGALTHIVWGGYGADYISPLNGGIGISYRSLMPNTTNNNVLYVGGGIEINTESAIFDSDDPFLETQENVIGTAVIGNFGYRWRRNGRYTSVGVIAGVNLNLVDEEFYTYDDAPYADYSGGAAFFGMFEIAFGWEKN